MEQANKNLLIFPVIIVSKVSLTPIDLIKYMTKISVRI